MNNIDEIVARNIDVARARIAGACARSGRSPADVTILAVTKYVGPEVCAALVRAGISDLGENRHPECAAKLSALSDLLAAGNLPAPRLHFIGRIQKRKMGGIVGVFDVLHAIEHAQRARQAGGRAAETGRDVGAYLQVNVSGEESKQGVAPGEAPAVARTILEQDGLIPLGLMTMAPASEDGEAARPVFAALRGLRDRLVGEVPGWPGGLSMGMSLDYPVAVEEGATVVRVGTALLAGLPPEYFHANSGRVSNI